MESFDRLFLWLATSLDRFCLLSRARTDSARELVDPASPIGTPTLLSDDGFAYVAFRQVDPETYEFGAYAHGPAVETIAATVVEQIRVWNRLYRNGSTASNCSDLVRPLAAI
jgi:protein-L-isoaspartate(D-aspartate) O-methyltransferase